MKLTRWFLPEEPDVIGLLRVQVSITLEGLDAFAAWAAGDADAARLVSDAETRGDAAKRELRNELRAAFVVPLEPEDVFALSRGIDAILNLTSDLVSEAEVMDCVPDEGIAEMAELLGQAVRRLDDAIALLGHDGDAATAAAEAAIAIEHRFDATYYRGMARLLEVEERGQRISLRELYRRSSQIGDVVTDVAERVMYAIVKQS